MKRLVILLEGAQTPSSRLRILPYVELLDHEGYVCTVVVIPKLFLKRVEIFFRVWRADLLIVQKKLFRPWELTLLLLTGVKLIYDFDDAVMAVPDFVTEARERERSRRERYFRATVIRSDWIIAGNEYLASTARSITERVSVIPTMIPIARYSAIKRTSSSDRTIIGWIGTKGNLGYLESLRPVFERLHRAYPQLCVRIVCDQFPDLGNIPQERIRWREQDEVQALADVDIGIMPLSDTEWTRGKNGYKLLQYMACGIAVVASPVGMNRALVEHGRNGYWAGSSDEWVVALSRLIESPPLRRTMGQEGRRMVEQSFTTEHGWRMFCVVIKRVLGESDGHVHTASSSNTQTI
jgi:glycosyltransferase involved in cell wall biosynthesis